MEEIKIKLEGLQVGMFVSRLDRPWIELPLLIEGLMIESNEDIDLLKKYCEYVYINPQKGRSASPMYWIFEKDSSPDNSSTISDNYYNQQFSLLREENYQNSTTLYDEYTVAEKIYQDINYKITKTFEDLKQDKQLNLDALKQSVAETVNSVIRNPSAFRFILELKKIDDYSYNHALATSVWCAQLGRHLGLNLDSLNYLTLGGLLLDIGKTQLPEELLHEKGKLDAEQIGIFRTHVEKSISLLLDNEDVPHEVMRMVATHHERNDGSGYPLGLKDKEIPIFGHIAGLVDSFDAMISPRSYTNRTLSPHQAIGQLYKLRGKIFHEDLVELFIQAIGIYPTGSLVELQSGEVGVVIEINGLKRLRPIVMILLDKDKNPLSDFYPIDLSQRTEFSIKRGLETGAYGIKMDELFL